ncbi:MAG: hypothetical protein JO334_07835 [Verrucomicrobia bacterium]|nr:hypothetical protein [Verrucomicrobiota bacterium]
MSVICNPWHPLLAGAEFAFKSELENGSNPWDGSAVFPERQGGSDWKCIGNLPLEHFVPLHPNGCDFGEEADRSSPAGLGYDLFTAVSVNSRPRGAD